MVLVHYATFYDPWPLLLKGQFIGLINVEPLVHGYHAQFAFQQLSSIS
jgi:hypothetical protein